MAVLLVLALGLGLWWAVRTPAPQREVAPAQQAPAAESPGEGNDRPTASTPAPAPSPAAAPALPSPRAWGEAFAQVPAAGREAWLSRWWAEAVRTREPAERVAWLLQFLASGVDARTGLAFRVGPGGALATAPSLRVQVLDWLGELDPAAAARQALEILDRLADPDEAALALRNLGRTLEEPSQDPYYIDRVRALLQEPRWQAQPTGGYLEAFDAAVYGRSAAFVVPLLDASLHAPHAGTRKAATMALDNLAGDDPLLVARSILAADSSAAEQPIFRASLLARLDPRIETHREALRHYLLEVANTPDELEVFAQTFPNANDFASHYLLTRQPGRPLSELAQTDLAAYRLVQAWQQDPAFADRATTLAALEKRLRGFLDSAVRGGLLTADEIR